MSDNTALLVMDVQQGIVERYDSGGIVERIAEAVTAARRAGVRVIFVRVAFRPEYPEIGLSNPFFASVRASGRLTEQTAAIDPRVGPLPGDTVVTKRRVSAFTGSDLDVVLRAADVGSLVLCGIATSGVVLSTLRAAADLDFRLTVLSDACADGDDEVHKVLMQKVFPRQADVVDVAEWADRLRP
jgi:nicotinamidase-related amidase